MKMHLLWFASGENSPKKTIAHDVENYGDIVKNCCKMALSKYLRPKTKVLSTTLLLALPTKARILYLDSL
jgi:hypothetical protein